MSPCVSNPLYVVSIIYANCDVINLNTLHVCILYVCMYILYVCILYILYVAMYVAMYALLGKNIKYFHVFRIT